MERELPMAVTGCALDDAGLRAQADRYRRLGAQVVGTTSADLTLSVRFGDELDSELLEETITVERGCCSFFTVIYEPVQRQLSISVTDRQHRESLEAIRSVLIGSG